MPMDSTARSASMKSSMQVPFLTLRRPEAEGCDPINRGFSKDGKIHIADMIYVAFGCLLFLSKGA
jgi:hypothetical protein